MEDKHAKLNIMNRKVNMDFFKNMMSPIKLSKLRSRKIFSAKGPPKSESVEPTTLSFPEGTCVDRSPVRISTISSLVEGAPDYDYSFGHISMSDSRIELNSLRTETEQSAVKPMKFSEKLSKQYKELSEFKLKHILAKKTIVRTTSIEVENYSHRPEDLISERSDFDFEFRSLPAGAEGGSFEEDESSTPEYAGSVRLKNEVASTNRRSESLQIVSKVEPNESSLWKHMHSISRKNTVRKSVKSVEENEVSTKTGSVSKRSFNRQNFEDACNKAKTTVTNKLQKLKSFQSRILDSKSAARTAEEDTSKKPDPDIILPRHSYESEYSARGRKKLSLRTSVEKPQPNAWKSGPVAQNSIDSERCISRRYLKSESSIDSSNHSVVTTRQAPPIPTSKRNVPKDLPRLPPDIGKIGLPRPLRSNIKDELSWRGHVRKPSSESIDSDSWIPDVFKGPSRNQINLDIIKESSDAWAMPNLLRRQGMHKSTSIDIFNSKRGEAFEDFDDELKNVPTVIVQKDHSKLKPELVEVKPLVEQTSINKEYPVITEERSINFNRLVGRFQDSSRSANGSSSGSMDSYPEHVTSFESKIIVHRGNMKGDENDEESSQQWPENKKNENTSIKYSINGRAPQLKSACRKKEVVSGVEEEADDDIFHSLDYSDSIPDSKRHYRLNSVKIVYSADV